MNLTGAELSVETYQEEVEQRHTISDECRIGKSLTEAITDDVTILHEALTDGNAAADDRAQAR